MQRSIRRAVATQSRTAKLAYRLISRLTVIVRVANGTPVVGSPMRPIRNPSLDITISAAFPKTHRRQKKFEIDTPLCITSLFDYAVLRSVIDASEYYLVYNMVRHESLLSRDRLVGIISRPLGAPLPVRKQF